MDSVSFPTEEIFHKRVGGHHVVQDCLTEARSSFLNLPRLFRQIHPCLNRLHGHKYVCPRQQRAKLQSFLNRYACGDASRLDSEVCL